MTSVLVVEDERSLRDPLVYLLQKEGFETFEAKDGKEALSIFAKNEVDLILLDLMLPVISGAEVCRSIRKTSKIPIIMLTAKDLEDDKVSGLELGADDYVTKPYSAKELLARMKAVLRRQAKDEKSTPSNSAITVGELVIDSTRHVAKFKGAEIPLPPKEFALLEFLVENLNRVLTRDQILDEVWGSDFTGDTKTLDVHIKRIRSKIEDDPARPEHLLTVRGLGYKYEA